MKKIFNVHEARGIVRREKYCRVCGLDALLEIERWGAFWCHCNNFGVEIPVCLIKEYPRQSLLPKAQSPALNEKETT